MRCKFYIVKNPSSGKAGQKRLDAVVKLLDRAGALIESITTSSHGEGCDQARKAALTGQFDMVIAAGGDGTVHDVACGLIGTQCPLGIIPTGTANVFACETGLDFAPVKLASALMSAPVWAIPVGRVNNEPFLFVVGIGFDGDAVRYFEAGAHRGFGTGGFIPPVLRCLISATDIPLQIRLDGIEHTAHWVIVTRAKHYAAHILLAPDARLDDEQLHVVLFSGSGRFLRLRQLAALLTGLLKYEPSITVNSCRCLNIEAKQPVAIQIDGEAKGQVPLELGIHPQRLLILCPNGEGL